MTSPGFIIVTETGFELTRQYCKLNINSTQMKTNWIKMLMLLITAVAAYFGFDEPDMMFATFPALAGVVWLITQAIKQIPKFSPQAVQITSWLVGFALAFSGWALGLGFLAQKAWPEIFLWAIGASMVANAIADAQTVQTLIEIIKRIFQGRHP
jgi:hypothetical protein